MNVQRSKAIELQEQTTEQAERHEIELGALEAQLEVQDQELAEHIKDRLAYEQNISRLQNEIEIEKSKDKLECLKNIQ